MGILDKFRAPHANTGKGSTKGFYFGATEAEGENKEGIQNLEHYFDDYLSILYLLDHEKFIFTGRKGAGKSAIAKFIKGSSDQADNSFAEIIRLNDFELERLIQVNDFDQLDNINSALFEWLVLVNIMKLVVKNEEGQYSKGYKKLEKFLQRNSGIVDVDKYQIQEVIEKRKFEANIGVLKHAFGGILGKYFDSKTQKAPFYKLIPPLREILEEVSKYQVNVNKEFWLLFDDLDVGFSNDDPESSNKIIELIRIAKKYNTEYLKDTNTKILIFLRDDIKKIIETKFPDSAKIFSSYEIFINWYDHTLFKIDENKTQLKQFM